MDAYTAARQGAKKKEKELGNVESLQKMITDLKSLPPGSNRNSDRRTSAPVVSTPIAIPAGGDAKLKPDAAPFTPSSPVNPLVSPTGGHTAESAILKNRGSFGGLNTSRHSGSVEGGNFDALLRQQEEAKLALEQQTALQRLQAQAAASAAGRNTHMSSGSAGAANVGSPAGGNLPPRFQRTSMRNQPLY